MRIGDLLVREGVLTGDQLVQALRLQREGRGPIGLICEKHFGVPPEVIERAWATQYATISPRVDPVTERFDPTLTEMITPRQAWQFRVLPIRVDETGDLLVATIEIELPRALRFATRVVERPVFLSIAEPRRLGEALCRRYPLPGMTPNSIVRPAHRMAS